MLQFGSRLLQRISPWGLVAAGAAFALTLPPVRRRLRAGAVLAVKGLLTTAQTIQSTGSAMRSEFSTIAVDARQHDDTIKSSIMDQRRIFAGAAAEGLMQVSDKARELSQKAGYYADDEDHVQAPREHDGLEDTDMNEAH